MKNENQMKPTEINEFYYYDEDHSSTLMQHANMVDVFAAVPPVETYVVLSKLRAGSVDGRTFGDGKHEKCACLLGTIARNQGVSSDDLIDKINEFGLNDAPDAQSYFMPITPLDRPTNHQRAHEIHNDILELLLSNPKEYSASRKGIMSLRYSKKTKFSNQA